MLLETILNRVQKFKSFVYQQVRWTDGGEALELEVAERANGRAKCSRCDRAWPGYDRLAPRRFEFVPLWGLKVFRVYAPRRLSQRLFIETAGLSSPLINQLKRIAAFQNLELYKKQNLRLFTALTPRVISCAADHPRHISLPRGCLDEGHSLLHACQSELRTEGLRIAGAPVEATVIRELTGVQRQAAHAMLFHETGVLVAPPGFGKTVLGTYLIAQRRCSALILVHRQPLLDQWRSQIGFFLGRDKRSIGQLGAGKRKLTGQIDVAMIQSLSRKDGVADVVAEYGLVIVDECHHLPAISFERVLSEVRARYVVGLTATPRRPDRPPADDPHADRSRSVQGRSTQPAGATSLRPSACCPGDRRRYAGGHRRHQHSGALRAAGGQRET